MSVSASGQQHVQLYRKSLLRKRLLRYATPGAAYVPFIGDGDLAAEHYLDRTVLGADLDSARVAFASSRLRGDIRVADCDSWPFPDVDLEISVADFDAYAEPYRSFRSFWGNAEKADRLVLFFTDGHKQGLMRTGHWHLPDGSKRYLNGPAEKRPVFHFYFAQHVWPWFVDFIEQDGYHVMDRMRYLRGMMLYWGAVVERG